MSASINGLVGSMKVTKDSSDKYKSREVYECPHCLNKEYKVKEESNTFSTFTGYCRICNHKLQYKEAK
jgi:predicted SprT family Zn-dependent metalloprotease